MSESAKCSSGGGNISDYLFYVYPFPTASESASPSMFSPFRFHVTRI